MGSDWGFAMRRLPPARPRMQQCKIRPSSAAHAFSSFDAGFRTAYADAGVREMNDVLVLVGSGIAILLGIVHFAATRSALKGFKGLPVNEAGMLLAIWNGVGFMLLFLGGLPMAMVLLDIYVGRAATVVGIAVTAFAGVLAIADFIAYRPTNVAMGKAVPFILAAIAVLVALGTFL